MTELSQSELEHYFLRHNALVSLLIGLSFLLEVLLPSYDLVVPTQSFQLLELNWQFAVFWVFSALGMIILLSNFIRVMRHCVGRGKRAFWYMQFSCPDADAINYKGCKYAFHTGLFVILILTLGFEGILTVHQFGMSMLAALFISYAVPILYLLRSY